MASKIKSYLFSCFHFYNEAQQSIHYNIFSVVCDRADKYRIYFFDSNIYFILQSYFYTFLYNKALPFTYLATYTVQLIKKILTFLSIV